MKKKLFDQIAGQLAAKIYAKPQKRKSQNLLPEIEVVLFLLQSLWLSEKPKNGIHF